MRTPLLLASCIGLFLVACSDAGTAPPAGGKLRLSTTTSVRDSGILDVLLAEFRTSTGIEVEIAAVGTGQALQRARDGLADVVLAHDRAGEEELVRDGFAVNRCEVMYNEFVLVGPKADPLALNGSTDVLAAMRRILDRGGPWLSRADDSGTHRRERVLWQLLGREPDGPGFGASKAGMGKTLELAAERGAYTLSDTATFGMHRERLGLIVVCEGDERLTNGYAILVVNPVKVHGADYPRSMQLVEFLASERGRMLISSYGAGNGGPPLFKVR